MPPGKNPKAIVRECRCVCMNTDMSYESVFSFFSPREYISKTPIEMALEIFSASDCVKSHSLNSKSKHKFSSQATTININVSLYNKFPNKK